MAPRENEKDLYFVKKSPIDPLAALEHDTPPELIDSESDDEQDGGSGGNDSDSVDHEFEYNDDEDIEEDNDEGDDLENLEVKDDDDNDDEEDNDEDEDDDDEDDDSDDDDDDDDDDESSDDEHLGKIFRDMVEDMLEKPHLIQKNVTDEQLGQTLQKLISGDDVKDDISLLPVEEQAKFELLSLQLRKKELQKFIDSMNHQSQAGGEMSSFESNVLKLGCSVLGAVEMTGKLLDARISSLKAAQSAKPAESEKQN